LSRNATCDEELNEGVTGAPRHQLTEGAEDTSIPAFALWCSASLLFLIHATMIRDAVFIAVQVVNLAAGGFIVWFCKRHEGEVCPSHREGVFQRW
jgi:hypothetical protein